MGCDPKDNKFLVIESSAIRTPQTDPVICRLDECFQDRPAHITSILRDSAKQLSLIKYFASLRGLDKTYPLGMEAKVEDKLASHYGYPPGTYTWQPLWSRLLNRGVLINPPKRARVLFDYFRHGSNRKGWMINQTYHSTGLAFDIGGAFHDNVILMEVESIVAKAINEIPDLGIRDYVIEHGNNCLHCDCVD